MSSEAELSPLRVGRVTASRLPGILGLSPYQSRDDVMRAMVRQTLNAEQEFSGNIATEWGNDHENDAIGAYEMRTGQLVHSGQDFVIHPNRILGASPDGLIGDDGAIECKCPYRGSFTHISQRPDYEAQCRLVMEVTGRQWCDFVVWRPDGINVSRVEYDPDWLPSVMPQVEAFLAEFRAIVASPELAAPHLAPLVDERLDEDWQIAAAEYLDAKLDADSAARVCEDARQRLIELAGDRPARGSGVYVIRSERKGSTSYAKALKELAPGADLAPYQSAPTVVYTVRTTAEGAK